MIGGLPLAHVLGQLQTVHFRHQPVGNQDGRSSSSLMASAAEWA
jgi:hypothetical protein